MHGHGKLCWPDGRSYEGNYNNDKKHGIGLHIWADGKKYYGNWEKGKSHGLGIYLSNEGEKKFGVWKNGKKEKWLSEKEFREINNNLDINFYE